MPDNLVDVLNGTISRLVARRKNAAEETARDRGKETMARVALRVASEAHVSFRTNIRAEFDKIVNDTDRDVEIIRQTAQQEQQGIDYDKGFVNELLSTSVDILNEYGVLDSNEDPGTRTTLEHDSSKDASADVAGKSMRRKTYFKLVSNENQRTDNIDNKKNAAVYQEDRSTPSRYQDGPSGLRSSSSLSLWTTRNCK